MNSFRAAMVWLLPSTRPAGDGRVDEDVVRPFLAEAAVQEEKQV
ncbi:hypothetical protein [Megasphaera sp.]